MDELTENALLEMNWTFRIMEKFGKYETYYFTAVSNETVFKIISRERIRKF
jgi:hypothetical protein